MDPEGYSATLDDLLAREAIRDCMYRYCHAIDRRDYEGLRLTYWPDATDDHISFSGNAYEFIEVIAPYLDSLQSSTHSVSNMLIRVVGDQARVETYWQVTHREHGQNGGPDYLYIAVGRYLDVFERRDGEWRVLRRKLVRDAYQVVSGAGDWRDYPRPPAGPHGSQKQTDPVRDLFGLLGPGRPA